MKLKKTAISLAAVLVIGTSAVVANAAGTEKHFSLDMPMYGGCAWSPEETKPNNKDFAEINPKTGYVTSESFCYLQVCKEKTFRSVETESKKLTELNKTLSLTYNDPKPGQRSTHYLLGTAGYYGANVSGYWTP